MARKPASTKADTQTAIPSPGATEAQDAPVSVANLPAIEPDDENTSGAKTRSADSAVNAPQDAPAADMPERIGGEEGSVLPADDNIQHNGVEAELIDGDPQGSLAAAVRAIGNDRAPVIPEGIDIAFADAGQERAFVKQISVTCHREGGRRRAGRRWDKGETVVEFDALSDYQLAQLKGDPQFTIRIADLD